MKTEEKELNTVLKIEAKIQGTNQRNVANDVPATNAYLWKTIEEKTIRVDILTKICKFLKIDIILRSKDGKREYKIK